MQITNLTEEFFRHVIQTNDKSGYESLFPDLFKHYYQFWASNQDYQGVSQEVVSYQSTIVEERLRHIEQSFATSGFILDSLKIVLFVGHGSTNGHAFESKEQFIVWIPVEMYSSVLATDVFISHEIAHALHYGMNRPFYFKSMAEKNQIFRQLVTEGVATSVAKTVMRLDDVSALWADYIPLEQAKAWYQQCEQREKELCKYILYNLESWNEENALFSMWDSGDVFRYRGGYYVGLRLIEHICENRKLALNELFSIGKDEFKKMTIAELKRLAE